VCGALADQEWFKLVPKQILHDERTPTVITAELLESFREQTPVTFDGREAYNTALNYGEKVVTKKIFAQAAP
jgi:hypothetical protein